MDGQPSLERNSRKRKLKQHYDEVKVEERIAEDENPRKVCRICKKELESGKALGGHMRVHAQELSSQRGTNGDGLICSSDTTPFCNLCGRAFHSWKSVYGHMRCHTGRQWKRIPTQSNDSADNPVRNWTCDLVSHISRWPMTGKRGRRSSLAVPEMDIMEAAQNLLWLSTGPPLEVERESCFVLVDESKKGPGCDMVEKKKRGRKKKKEEVQVDPGAGTHFQCVTCSKKFSTYQALGGHRSKHYKERNAVGSCFFHPQNGTRNYAEQVWDWGMWEAPRMVPI